MNPGIGDRAAVAGIGSTEFSKDSGRSELTMAIESILAACSDCGVDPRDIDGLVTYTYDNTWEIDLVDSLGLRELRLFSKIPHGGGATGGCIQQAVMALACGIAETVVVYRSLNGRSAHRYGAGVQTFGTAELLQFAWTLPFGVATAASFSALWASRYMHQTGATSEDLGRVAVAGREFAATNPAAFFHGKPITLEDHQTSRMIASPLRLLDCCQESDGAVALVMTSVERARDLRQVPVVIRAAAQGSTFGQRAMTSYYTGDDHFAGLPSMRVVANQLWAQSGLGPDDIQTAVLYDHFTPFVLNQLEEFGFCARGEGKDFVRDGQHAAGGRLPVNPNGGQLGEAYVHGMNGVAEAVRQVRGTAVNQQQAVEHVLATSGGAVPTSAVILGIDR
ncbi:MAG TPA: lipid-transfer protein [Pseudonocardia sp.]